MELEHGEVICDSCEGETFIRYTEQRGKHFYPKKITCPKCNGHGKLDWVENITGTKRTAKRVWPELKSYGTWHFYGIDDDNPPYKRSSEEIKQRINPNYQKLLHRKNAYSTQRK